MWSGWKLQSHYLLVQTRQFEKKQKGFVGDTLPWKFLHAYVHNVSLNVLFRRPFGRRPVESRIKGEGAIHTSWHGGNGSCIHVRWGFPLWWTFDSHFSLCFSVTMAVTCNGRIAALFYHTAARHTAPYRSIPIFIQQFKCMWNVAHVKILPGKRSHIKVLELGHVRNEIIKYVCHFVIYMMGLLANVLWCIYSCSSMIYPFSRYISALTSIMVYCTRYTNQSDIARQL